MQRFLQEYPQHRTAVANLSVREWFDVRESDMAADWRRFLIDFEHETSPEYAYSMLTLRGYLMSA